MNRFKIKDLRLKIFSFVLFCIIINHSSSIINPSYAEVDIGKEYAFGDINTLGAGVQRLVYPTFSLAAAIVILYFLIGAFRLLMSGGEKETVAGAKNMITHAIIGFIILIFAFLVLQFILSAVFGIKGLNLIGVT